MSRRRYFQTSWVVPDLEAAIHGWVRHASVGPFFHLPHLRIGDALYRGSPCAADISVAVAQVGPMQIELIEQHNGAPSPFTDGAGDRSEPTRGGVGGTHHHVAAISDDLDADLRAYADIGVEVVFSGVFGDARFAYLDTRPGTGCMTELLERRPAMDGLFALIAAAGADWDGSDPIRAVPGA